MRVCSRHFRSGKPAGEMPESDPDWVPSVHLGHDGGTCGRAGRTSRRRRRRWAEETRPTESNEDVPQLEAAGGDNMFTALDRAVPPWREARSVLRSLLTGVHQQPDHDSPDRHAAEETAPSFRDVFRDSLEASLEASVRSRARSRDRSKRESCSSRELRLELNVDLPPVGGDSETRGSSPCSSCVQLQTRIQELEEKLSRITGDPIQPVQVSQSPEAVHEAGEDEEDVPEWAEPLSPSHCDPADEPDPRGQQRYRRFRKQWLDMFWFLRYSPSLDHMWCHVCRLHADNRHRHLSLIRGSRLFRLHHIKEHGHSKYHRANTERYALSMCSSQP